MVTKQLIHQDSGTAKIQKITSNALTLFLKTVLWFQLSRGELIIMPLIMVMLRFNLKSLQLNLTLNLFQIHTLLR